MSGEETKQPEVQGEESISKEEFSKMREEFTSMKTSYETLKKENDELKQELLSPEYLRKLAGDDGEATIPQGQAPSKDAVIDYDSMSQKEFAEFMEAKIANKFGPQINNTIKALKDQVQLLEAKEELARMRAKYTDFDDNRDRIIKKIRSNPSMDYETAYLAVRGEEYYTKTKEEQERAARAQSEKPGGRVASSLEPREFKSKAEAMNAAWEDVVGNKGTI